LTLFTQLATEAVDGEREGEAMKTGLNERITAIEAALERQDLEWDRARRALAQMSEASVTVPKAFLEQLDRLAGSSALPRNAARV
jgi:hypothetical protein